MFRAFTPALLAIAAYAQTAVDPARLGELLPLIESHEPGTLRCEATGLTPVLDFSMRFQAAYTVRVPLAQFAGPGHRLSVLVRVRPDSGGSPVYLVTQFPVPEAPATPTIQVGGGYLLGPGHYSARTLIYDETGRVCHHEWTIDAHLGPGQSGIQVAMPANTVAEFSAVRTAPVLPQPKLDGLTVLLDAAPLDPRMSSLPSTDVTTLTNALASLLEQAPARHVRVVVFNLDLQKELLREDDFTADGMSRVSAALSTLEVAAVDYRVLQNRGGHLALLADLVNRERRAPEPSDAVVFLGSRVLYHDKVAAGMIEEGAAKPRFYLIQFRPYPHRAPSPDITESGGRRGRGTTVPVPDGIGGRGGRGAGRSDGGPQADYPDTISFLISRLKGKTFLVHAPADFARAIRSIVQAQTR